MTMSQSAVGCEAQAQEEQTMTRMLEYTGIALDHIHAMRPELIQATELLRLNTPEAVEEAIGLLQNTVYSFSMKVCGHPQDAEDTMQEVLSRSLGHLAKIQDPAAAGRLALHRHQKSVLAHAPQACKRPVNTCSRSMS